MKTFQCLDCDGKLEVARFTLPEKRGERAKCPCCKGVLPACDDADLLRYRLVSLPIIYPASAWARKAC
jgi:NAD-dependent SIR2 family protein deacetylase